MKRAWLLFLLAIGLLFPSSLDGCALRTPPPCADAASRMGAVDGGAECSCEGAPRIQPSGIADQVFVNDPREGGARQMGDDLPDASSTPGDASTRSVDGHPDVPRSDGGSSPVDGGVTERPLGDGVEAVIVSPSTCQDRGLHVRSDLFRPGFRLWHLCYTTPRTFPFIAGEMPGRPINVTFFYRPSSTARPMEVIRIPSPASANPWTASAVIRIPDAPTGYPRFNAESDLDVAGQYWAVDRGSSGEELEVRGTLRAWELTPDAHQTRVEFRAVANGCSGSSPSMLPPAGDFIIPSLCPPDLLRCEAGPFRCRL